MGSSLGSSQQRGQDTHPHGERSNPRRVHEADQRVQGEPVHDAKPAQARVVDCFGRNEASPFASREVVEVLEVGGVEHVGTGEKQRAREESEIGKAEHDDVKHDSKEGADGSEKFLGLATLNES